MFISVMWHVPLLQPTDFIPSIRECWYLKETVRKIWFLQIIFLRDNEPWAPMLEYDNGLDDLYGILCISGNNNSVIANHISEIIHTQSIKPAGAKPVIIHIVSGKGNYISDNHIVATTEATDEQTKASDSCFSAQVDALTTTDKLVALDVTAVLVEKESVQNTILDSGSEGQVIIDRTVNAFRATPVPGV